MNNVMRVVAAGVCTGCNACAGCKHIRFEKNPYGFCWPIVDDTCRNCGACLNKCLYDPGREDED